MTDVAYYNEFDKYAAAWLRNLINAGVIAPGIVDERSIEDVRPDDLYGFTQCHFFAGIGIWSHALRAAGWADSRPVWTGSCPCQPFSQAGEGNGFDDPRHLWPHFRHLIREHQRWCRQQKRPSPIILGEQVASKSADPWIDLVCTDMEAMGNAFGAVAFPSAGVGAPHIRDRTYWVAYPDNTGLEGRILLSQCGDKCSAGQGGMVDRMADAGSERRNGRTLRIRSDAVDRASCNLPEAGRGCGALLGAGNCANGGDVGPIHAAAPAGPTNGFWRDADWLGCRDGKWRPVESGTFPLVNGDTSRVGRLRAYGNAINAEAAKAFIQSVMLVVD